MTDHEKIEFSQNLLKFAKDKLHVDLFGICEAKIDVQTKNNLRDFLNKGFNGKMRYLENYKLRTNPNKLLPGINSVIVLGINYYRQKEKTNAGEGRVARYAWSRDYHKIFKKILQKLVFYLEQNFPRHMHRICVDSAPIMEKIYAARAGLGFYGKNGLIINPQIGSFFLLGEVLTTVKLPSLTWQEISSQSIKYTERIDRNVKIIEKESQHKETKLEYKSCGTCTRCIDACPTGALISPGKMDARRCISYLTIESRSIIPEQFSKACGNLIMGCDICQEVCPYNIAHAKPASHPEFTTYSIAGDSILLEELLQISDDEAFLERFAGSPFMRPKREGIIKNAINAAFNVIQEQPNKFRTILIPLIEKISVTDNNKKLRKIAKHYLKLLNNK